MPRVETRDVGVRVKYSATRYEVGAFSHAAAFDYRTRGEHSRLRLAPFKTSLRGTERRRLVFESRGGRAAQHAR